MAQLEWKEVGAAPQIESPWFWVASTSVLSGLIIGYIIGKINF
ncbi:MAG: hypothetical protein AAB588_04600 [Patescibacteria group bacterium]